MKSDHHYLDGIVQSAVAPCHVVVNHATVRNERGLCWVQIGVSSFMWRQQHVVGHHAYTNLACDPDIRVSECDPRRVAPHHPKQSYHVCLLHFPKPTPNAAQSLRALDCLGPLSAPADTVSDRPLSAHDLQGCGRRRHRRGTDAEGVRRVSAQAYQHVYLAALYGLLKVKSVLVDDFAAIARGSIGQLRLSRMTPGEAFMFWACKVLYAVYYIALPALYSPHSWRALATLWLIAEVIAGWMLAFLFQV